MWCSVCVVVRITKDLFHALETICAPFDGHKDATDHPSLFPGMNAGLGGWWNRVQG